MIRKIDEQGRYNFPMQHLRKWGLPQTVGFGYSQANRELYVYNTNAGDSSLYLIERRRDTNNRTVIPKEIRKALQLREGDILTLVHINQTLAIYRKLDCGCMLCNDMEISRLIAVKGMLLCESCIREAAELAANRQ